MARNQGVERGSQGWKSGPGGKPSPEIRAWGAQPEVRFPAGSPALSVVFPALGASLSDPQQWNWVGTPLRFSAVLKLKYCLQGDPIKFW